jgi:flagellar hook-associated protein FlgK
MSQMMPAWAEAQLRGSQHVAAEHALLREFFNAWQDLHTLPNDKLHRRKAELAAQRLIDIADQIERMIDPVQIKRTTVHE